MPKTVERDETASIGPYAYNANTIVAPLITTALPNHFTHMLVDTTKVIPLPPIGKQTEK